MRTTERNGKAAERLDAAIEYLERGFPVVLCDGKQPLGGENWQHKRWDERAIRRAFQRNPELNIGMKNGPLSGIDIEADGPEEEALLADLFDGCEIPIGPTYESARGKHRWFAWDDRLAECGEKAVVSYRGRNGGKAKLGVRIGHGKAAQSIVPPSPGRSWIPGLSFGECELPKPPDKVIDRIVAATKPKAQSNGRASANRHAQQNGRDDNRFERCRRYVAKMDAAIDGQGGSVPTFAAACTIFRFGLSDDDAWKVMQEFNERCVGPWSDEELQHKLEGAKARVEADGEFGIRLRDDPAPRSQTETRRQTAGQSEETWQSETGDDAEPISNYTTQEVETEKGKKKEVPVPRSMNEIIDEIDRRMEGWPRRIDNMLFVDDPEHGLDYFDRRTTAGLFGWLRRHHQVQWTSSGSFVKECELFAEIERTAKRYEAIELLPHEPPVPGIYYRTRNIAPGDGSYLRKLLDRFRPETTIDRDLIQAGFMTPAWGGLPGSRPAFVVTSDQGRGVGKSKVPEAVGYLYGGHIDVSAGEDIEGLKTRMLSPAARTMRIALLDNIKSLRLSWAALEAMITSPVISGKQMYVGEGQRPNLLTWYLTLNGVSMATDMAQRSVIIKIVKGKNDGPWWEETRDFIDQNRERIIGDIIGALRADPFPLAEFSRWAAWEQHVLCRLPEPGEAQRLILERQGEANCELDEAEIIEDHFEEQLAQLHYDPQTAQVRIPVSIVGKWYGEAVGERTKTNAVTRKLRQMADEGSIKKLAPDPSRTYGRCFVWTGAEADVENRPIENDLKDRIAVLKRDTRVF